ncbi:helix-turn-helix domain-containing protein, partial [Pseudorhodoplanes sp.]|uniref:helix-turn-helix domain-containing protein n=1 Tax=Pseudorhodoplanes sp. TaxID=1934341 RepID=UPI003D0C0EAD
MALESINPPNGVAVTKQVYDIPEAGRMLGLSRNAAYAAAARGEIPIIEIGRLKKVPKAALHK